jgi:hypothetical protein
MVQERACVVSTTPSLTKKYVQLMRRNRPRTKKHSYGCHGSHRCPVA